jgi:hypothetical protein
MNRMRINYAAIFVILMLSLISMSAFLPGCASHKTVDMQSAELKRITEISISDNTEAVAVIVKGGPLLAFEAIKQVDPAGIVFRFPETTIEGARGVFSYPTNELISSIAADEIVHDATTTARIRIVLKVDRPYLIQPDAEGIQVVFAKSTGDGKPIETETAVAPKEEQTEPTLKSMPAATRLIAVTATKLQNKVAIHVDADGSIQDFTAFTLAQPARIVIDMYRIVSSHPETQQMTVDSKWVSGVRYSGRPDKVRLVLDTHPEYLSSYSVLPTDTGLLIQVGEID